MDQHQQTSQHPESSLTSETSHWTSSSLDFVPLKSSSRPWFPNEMQNLLLSEKRTLDHWATVQLFFSLAQVRCFWRCFCFRSGLVALFLKMSEWITELCEQPPLSVMTFCDLPSLWKVSMIAFLTIVYKSSVFPIIVVSKNKRYLEFIL